MFLHRDDIKKIGELIEKFPNAQVFELYSDNSSGIGAEVTMKVQTVVNDIEGTFEIVVSSVENW
jgi:hypothetical protein